MRWKSVQEETSRRNERFSEIDGFATRTLNAWTGCKNDSVAPDETAFLWLTLAAIFWTGPFGFSRHGAAATRRDLRDEAATTVGAVARGVCVCFCVWLLVLRAVDPSWTPTSVMMTAVTDRTAIYIACVPPRGRPSEIYAYARSRRFLRWRRRRRLGGQLTRNLADTRSLSTTETPRRCENINYNW